MKRIFGPRVGNVGVPYRSSDYHFSEPLNYRGELPVSGDSVSELSGLGRLVLPVIIGTGNCKRFESHLKQYHSIRSSD